MLELIEPQLCHLIERPPPGDGWLHKTKFDGYRMQVRIENGKVIVRTRKDWADLPDAILTARSWRSTPRAPDFAALQAVIADEKTDKLVLFVFDLLHAGTEDSESD